MADLEDFKKLIDSCDYDFLLKNLQNIKDYYKEAQHKKYVESEEDNAALLKEKLDELWKTDEEFKELIQNIRLCTKLWTSMSSASDQVLKEEKIDYDDIYDKIHLYYPEVLIKIPEKYEFLINNFDNFTYEDGSRIDCDTWTFSKWFCSKFELDKENKYYHLNVIAQKADNGICGNYYICGIGLPIWD